MELAKLAAFRECFIEYPQISEIYSTFDRLIFNHTLGGEQESLLLTGDAGCGKSSLITNYVARYNMSSSRWDEQVILSTRIPCKVKESDTFQMLLKDLGNRLTSRVVRNGNQFAYAESVIKLLKQKNIKLVIIDEIQELIEHKTADERLTIANTLKMISEEARVSFVLVGLPYSKLIAEESQWGSRLGIRRHIEYFKMTKVIKKNVRIEDTAQKEHFANFVAGFAARMGFDETPNLTSDEILYPLFSICKGQCRSLKHFLEDALMIAFKNKLTTINQETLSETFIQRNPNAEVNPFTCGLSNLCISELKTETNYNKNAALIEDRLIEQRYTDLLPVSMLLSKHPIKS